MLNRGLFDSAINEKQLGIFKDYIYHCLSRLQRQPKKLSVAECVEPSNPKVEVDELSGASRKPKLSARSSIPSNLMAYGLRFMGLATLFNTVSAKTNVYIVLPGIPKNETATCDFNKWLGCIEAFIANETDTLARFLLAGTTYYNATVSNAANYLGNKVAVTADPLVKILSSMLVYYPDWQNDTKKCVSIGSDPHLDAAIYGNTTAIGESACYFFQAKTMKLGEAYLLDYVRDVAKAEAYPEPTPHQKIVIIMFAVSIISAFGLSGGMGYMASQIEKFNKRMTSNAQDEHFAQVSDEVKEQSDSEEDEKERYSPM